MIKYKAYNIIKSRYPNSDKERMNKKINKLILNETKETIDKMLIIEKIIKNTKKSREYLNELDIIELRKMNMSKDEIKFKLNKELLDTKLKKIRGDKYVKPKIYIDNIDFLFGYKKYIYVGHGWNTDKVFNIQNKKNVYIVMLDSTVSCVDNMKFDFIEELKKSKNSIEYIKKINNVTKKLHNDFCMYSSNSEFHIVPDMLISTYKNKREFTALIDIDEKTVVLDYNTTMLSDIVKKLGDKNSFGNDFFLQVYTCRNQIDTYQMKNIHFEIKDYIIKKKITILKEGDIIETPKYSPFI